MSNMTAEQHFHRGLAALAEARCADAASLFLEAMRADCQDADRRPDMRFLSYYGLSLARAGRVSPMALQACRHAAEAHPSEPILQLNLGRVLLLAGRRDQALETLERARRATPDHAPLLRELSRVDRRRRPLVGFLDRSHPLNRWAGRVRSRMSPH